MHAYSYNRLITLVLMLTALACRCMSQKPTWHATGLAGGPWRALACAPHGFVCAGGSTNDVVSYSTDNGNSWTNSALPGAGTINKLSATKSGEVLAGTDGGVFRTPTEQIGWTNIGPAAKVLSVLGYSADTILAGTEGHGIFRTTNAGSTWSSVGRDTLNVLDIRAGNGDTVYAACVQDGVFRSTDKGATWANTADFKSAVCNLAVDSHGWVYGTIRLYYDASLGEYRSTDGGASWVNLWTSSAYSTSVGLEVNSSGDVYFATSAAGLYCYTHGAWQSGNDGLPDAYFYWLESLAINDKDELFAGTYGNGVYVSNATMSTVRNTSLVGEGLYLFQNFPNPFNPRTDIRFSVAPTAPRDEHASGVRNVRLCVYDLLGREVAVLVDEKKPAGVYEIQFDGSRLPSGVYFYRLQSGTFQETKRLVLMK